MCKPGHISDLSARNVLVGKGGRCKVTDFGMARNVEQDDIYTKKSRVRLALILWFIRHDRSSS